MIRTVNIRALKDKLSAYLRNVRQGDVVLVSDRGRVVAEIRQPTIGDHALRATRGKLEELAEQGVVRLGMPNSPKAYRDGRVHLSDRVSDSDPVESIEAGIALYLKDVAW